VDQFRARLVLDIGCGTGSFACLHAARGVGVRSREELGDSLATAGWSLQDIRDAPDRPGREFVFIARRPS